MNEAGMQTGVDMQHPERLIDCLGHDGKMYKAPFLIQRDGETLDEFFERARRVEEAANGHDPTAMTGAGIPLAAVALDFLRQHPATETGQTTLPVLEPSQFQPDDDSPGLYLQCTNKAQRETIMRALGWKQEKRI